MSRLSILASFVIALSAVFGASAATITSVVAYGDSYSDNGNLGRESNGPVIVEQLAADLRVPIINHAWVGATTGIGNLSDNGGLTFLGNKGYPGMTTTVAADLANPPANVASNLYVVWGGHNDILVNGQDQGVLNVVNIVKSLQAAGAEHILVPGVMDLGLTPFGNRPAVKQQFTAISSAFNTRLEQLLPGNVTYVDTAAILRNIVANPTKYDLTNVTSACSFPVVCANPDRYLFWDSFHPTTKTDGIFAADFAQAVTAVSEPASLLLFATGSLFLFKFVSFKNTRKFGIPHR